MGMEDSAWWVDHARRELHHGGRVFPCDRDVEALAVWQGHALLLSSDTDCLSLWDEEGLVRLASVGVYPQDMAVMDTLAIVCGGADCRLHLLDLPSLSCHGEIHLPGMAERIALQDDIACILALLTEPEVHTQLILASLPAGKPHSLLTLPGIPGAIAADGDGLWLGVSGQVLHLPRGTTQPDMIIKGFEMPVKIDVLPHGVIITDALRERPIWLRRMSGNEKGALTLR